MGTLVKPLCHCGFYDSEFHLSTGSGRAGDESKHKGIPACCNTCHDVVWANDLDNPVCAKCGNPVVLYSESNMHTYSFPEGDPSGPERACVKINYGRKSVVLPIAFYKCPRCGEYRMRFAEEGTWD